MALCQHICHLPVLLGSSSLPVSQQCEERTVALGVSALESDCSPALERSEEFTAAVGFSAIGSGCLPAVAQHANCSSALGVLASRCQKPVVLAAMISKGVQVTWLQVGKMEASPRHQAV